MGVILIVKCKTCQRHIRDLPFKCHRCGQYFCSRHRLPENHRCIGLKKGNVFLNIAQEKHHHASYYQPDIYTTHFFITNIFNPCFNEIIGKYLESKEIGRIRGGLHDITLRKEHPNYWMALRLVNLRDEFFNKNKIDMEDIRNFVRSITTLLEETDYHPELTSATHSFLKIIKNQYRLTFKIIKKPRQLEPPVKLGDKIPPTKPPKIETNVSRKLLKRLVIFLLIFVMLLYAIFSNTTREVREEKLAIKTTQYNETVSNKISFKNYMENIYDVEGQEAEIKGFLRRYIKGSESAGVYVEGLADDQNNTIDLINLNSKIKKMFPQKGITEEVYKIKGTFKRKYKTLQLEPKKIELSQRDPAGIITKEKSIEYKENITRNVIMPRFPIVRSFVFGLFGKEVLCEDGTPLNNCSTTKPYFCSYNGLSRKATKCGCPENERLYHDECIKKVKCSDETLEPECSKNKPKKCINGKLVDDSDLCGCPEDYKKVGNTCEKIKRCKDGTLYGVCSENQPYFCTAGALVKDPDQCGCGLGYRPWEGDCINSNKVEALEAFDYINEIRKENGRSELQWNDDLYELAMFRCKDMYDKKYFDHVTPEGKCVKDFQDKYGLGGYNIAENAGAVTYGGTGTNIDYASYADVKSQIDGWMQSRGHRYNLLYPSHIYGVATCYKGACVFLGANQEYYGLGYGPCTTGAQGLAFWESVGQQPGET